MSSLSEERSREHNGDGCVAWLLRSYLAWLKSHPFTSRAITSGVLGGLGPVVSHAISTKSLRNLPANRIFAYATFGFAVSGPVYHAYYMALEKFFPRESNVFLKIAVDRLLFAPPMLYAFFVVSNMLQGKSWAETKKAISLIFWESLKTNWKVWVGAQYVNMTRVPVPYRALFGSVVALLWNIILALSQSI